MTGHAPSTRAGPRVLFWVQHLLGIGHVHRATLLARAMAAAGLRVTVASGGFPVAGTDFGPARVVPLPPARAADPSFRVLLDAEGAPIDDAWRARRRAALLDLAAEVRPDLIVTETWPFGRRSFAFELEPLIEAARRTNPALVVAASVRDILVEKPAKKTRAMAETARAVCDLVLVHGDPTVVPFEASFPDAPLIADRIAYTGYVAPPRRAGAPDPGASTDGRDAVIVAAGGGAVGAGLFEAAAGARALSRRAGDTVWRLLLGPDLPEAAAASIRRRIGTGIVVEAARPDYPDLLAGCRLSVSQAGYNTVMDVLAAGCRALFVPFAADGETEQATRARLLAERGLAGMVAEAGLDADRLAAAVDRVLAGPAPPRPTLKVDGARESGRLLSAALGVRVPVPPGGEADRVSPAPS
ncbi:MAG: glycosyltransferase [Azospirillaceae bacterium]